MLIPKPILRGTRDEQFEQLIRYVNTLVDMLNNILVKETKDNGTSRSLRKRT